MQLGENYQAHTNMFDDLTVVAYDNHSQSLVE